MDKFSNGQVAIANTNITYRCGSIKLHKGSIVKVIDCNSKFCIVYRNKRRELINDDMSVPTSCLDVPENMEEMKRSFELGIKNVN